MKQATLVLIASACVGLSSFRARADSFVEFDFNIHASRARSTAFIELFDDRPLTTANFLQYVNSGRYNGSLMHRLALDQSSNPFVLQGGGYYPSYIQEPNTPLQESLNPNVTVDLDGNPLTPNPTVQNEYNNSPTRPNVTGTIAMAKVSGDPNSASNQFFFNLEDNSTTLNQQNNGGFTVFGGVIGDGMTLINAYAQQLPIVNLNPDTNDDGKPDAGPFDTVPIVFSSNFFVPLILNRAKVVDYLG
ncbi:MAG TPA: peptidylprolyl isomerase, partial [Lacipirellulaceae bacterium]|nr:peptidylprolyl isomerase [Lacipirellulaceae bacterium]